jgi:hypothetical protein
MVYITSIFIFLFILLLFIFFKNNKSVGSDHFFHFKLSNEIRENEGELITHFKHLVIPTPIYYPQLYHKLLSLFSKKFVTEKGHLLNYFFNSLLVIGIASSIFLFKKELHITNTNIYKILFIFVTTPFFYVFWNAKNMGLSGRSFGLFLGQIYLLSLLYFIHTNNYFIIILLSFISCIAWFGSNFAFQAILFISILFSFFYLNQSFYILLPVVIGFAIWFILNPKVAKIYYLELIRLKIMFFNYLIFTMSLNNRPSIWGDFITGFHKKYKTDSKKNLLIYIYTNSIISALLGYPIVFILIYYIAINANNLVSFQKILTSLFLSGFLVFIFTTFRKTRFLGEPERYLEFILPACVLLSLTLKNINLNIIIVINLILLLLNYFIILNKKGNTTNDTKNNISAFINKINIEQQNQEIKILSNNETISRYLMEYDNIKLFFAYISKPETLGVPFNDIYQKFGDEYQPKALNRFYKCINFDYLIINSNNLDTYISELKCFGDIDFENLIIVETFPNIVIYKIIH